MARPRKKPNVVVLTTLQSDSTEKLRQHVAAIERLREDARSISMDISTRFKAAQSDGFDLKALKRVLEERKRSQAEMNFLGELCDLYRHALGMTPIEAEIERQKEEAERGKTDAEIKRDDPDLQKMQERASAEDLARLAKGLAEKGATVTVGADGEKAINIPVGEAVASKKAANGGGKPPRARGRVALFGNEAPAGHA